MKKIFSLSAILAVGLTVSSCLGTLDTLPLNETDFTADKAYGTEEGNYVAGLTKVYTCFVNTSDLQVADAGSSEFIRANWNINECSTDEAKSAMQQDSWVKDINENAWSVAENAATYATYARSMHGISYANEYLRQTSDDKLDSRGVDASLKAKIHGFRNEARIIRAYFYWALIDTFGNVPKVTEETEVGATPPEQATRQELFDYVVTELKELAESPDTPAARSNYPRVDKGSAYGLLVRMYINAEVYTGKAMWSEAKTACEKIFGMGYDLCPEYSWLFCGDNGENPEAIKELLMAVFYDADRYRGRWGGTTYLTSGAVSADSKALVGDSDSWSSIRATNAFVTKHFNVTNVNPETGTFDCDDDRSKLFYIKGRKAVIEDITNFNHGWEVHKFSNVPHDQTPETCTKKRFGMCDFPLIRLADIYLMYAEACLKLNDTKTGLPYVNKVRSRAGVSEVSSYDADFLVDERARELYWESLRRVDLIRFGKFTSGTFLWPFKGGSYDGQSIPDFRKIFAIPPSEMAANPNLVQNPGYNN